MDRTLERELIRATLRALDAGPAHGDAPDTRVPVGIYLDEDRFTREREAWHETAPNLLAHASELPSPGDFVTRDLLGKPVILVRGDDGRVRALLNVCRHRGATVELREQGRCTRFVCPYHAWTYHRDGALAGVPLPEGFPSLDVASTRLAELPCEEVAGLIWVAPRPGGSAELDPHLRALLSEVEGLGPDEPTLFARSSQVWRANWKLLVEGGLESYHFAVAHRNTVGPLFVGTGSTYARFGDHFRLVLPRRSMKILAGRPEEEWRIVEHANVLYILRPNVSILVQDGHYVLITMNPVSVDETRVDMATIGRPTDGGKAAAFLQANHDFTVRTLEEDFVLGEQIQRGLASGANTHLRFARFESALRDLHDGLDAALAAGGAG